ncbi:uncharacterized protein LOC116846731 [Odontomachus brunneus]|uniref:uncharacterized protein LOC116846731 n=1 Tax=Odontomachus brunneus TaxID=486640 RepID=UPI0013F1E23A|nr:uncharacterized protein LOC116846731 [Odontomachus brunneus]
MVTPAVVDSLPHRKWGWSGKGKANFPQARDRKPVKALPKVPRSAALTVRCPNGSYADVMRRARDNIDQGENGIGEDRTRRADTGVLVLEISDPEGHARTNALAEKMSVLFADKQDVRIARPTKRAEIRVRDLNDWVAVDDVVSAMAAARSYGSGNLKVGAIRLGSEGIETLWLQCPVTVAKKIVNKGRIRVGWSSVRVEALARRPLLCLRCLELGHVRATCKAKTDRSGLCFH